MTWTPPDKKKCKVEEDDGGYEKYLHLMETLNDASTLKNPALIKKSSFDINNRLQPRHLSRNRQSNRQRVSPSSSLENDQSGRTNIIAHGNHARSLGFSKASGFVSAASLLPPLVTNNTANAKSQGDVEGVGESHRIQSHRKIAQSYREKSPTKKRKHAVQSNKLTNYFKPTPPSKQDESIKLEMDSQRNPSTPTKTPTKSPLSSQGSTSTFLYSPIRKMEGSEIIYISDDSPSSQSSRKLFGKQTTSHAKSANGLSQAKSNISAINDCEIVQSTSKKRISASDAAAKQSDVYGLLGTGQAPATPKVNWFAMLPVEILENIFCCLPNLDLCLSVPLVCKDWKRIVYNEKFIPWKKRYHKIKAGNGAVLDEVQNVMQRNRMVGYPSFLPQLVRYMKNFKPITAHNMTECLQHHPKYNWVLGLFQERFQDLLVDEVPSPWSTIAALVVLAGSVRDVEDILRCLSHSSSDCTVIEVLECLYCLAAFLLVFKKMKRDSVWNRLHYQVYYALYLHENRSTMTTDQVSDDVFSIKGQQSIMKYSNSCQVQLTHEQMRIVNHKGGKKDVVKIVAFAGTGKTTTLVRYTQMRPGMSFLLVNYNKSVSEEAKKRFPSNVTCKTGHSLAFGPVGFRYKHKFGFNLKVGAIADIIPHRKGTSLYVRAKWVMDTLSGFMASADPFITTAHTPTRTKDNNNRYVAISYTDRQEVAEDADVVWKKMIDRDNKKVLMVHDGYVKLYQLKKPTISGYDCILIDEAQDLTPAIADVLLSQNKPKILVGDPHQQIYAFRGAVNAMQRIDDTHVYYLTQSMRFGPEISFVAASCLELYKNVETKTIVGNGKAGHTNGQVDGQLAIITRCNYTLFKEAARECCYSGENTKKIAFVGGTDGFGFPMIRDIYTLMLPSSERSKGDIKHPFISKFTNLGELEKYATKTSDNELLGKIKIVRTYTTQLPQVMSQISRKVTKSVDFADVVFSTAHKAKGLEFNTVRVTDDYTTESIPVMSVPDWIPGGDSDDEDGFIPELQNHSQSDMESERNLLYVAVTRAKKSLILNNTLVGMLRQVGVNFEIPTLSKTLQENGTAMKCLETDHEFQPCCLTLEKQKVVVEQNRKLEDGVYSPTAVATLLRDVAWRNVLGPLPKSSENKDNPMSSSTSTEL